MNVLNSGKWWRGGDLNQDSRVRDFETAFARLHRARHGVAVANGTLALELSLRAAGIGHGDEVIVPAYTFIATATAVLMVGAKPVFCDVEPETLCIDMRDAERRITRRTRAIMPVHMAGNVADMDAVIRVARGKKLTVIEDAAQAQGARWGRKPVGALGDMGCFSFQASKMITGGEGGIVLTDGDDLAELLFSIHHIGRKRGGQFYMHYRQGGNFRMTEWQGAILLSQMKRFPAQQKIREANVKRFLRGIRGIPGLAHIESYPKAVRSHHIVILRYEQEDWNGVPCARVIKAVQAEGIYCIGGYSLPVHKNPLFTEKPEYRKVSCPVSEAACGRLIWFPHQHFLGTPADADDIARTLAKIHENRSELERASS